MSDFSLYANIKHLGPAEFTVIVSAVPELPAWKVEVVMEDATSRQQAEEMLKIMLVKLGETVTARGDTVVDVVAA